VPNSSSDAFEIHERPTAQRARPLTDMNATTKVAKADIENLVRSESGTRPVVTNEQIETFMRERTAEITGEPAPDSFRDRETLDAATLAKTNELAEGDEIQRHTLVMAPSDVQSTAQQIPIDVDLSRMAPMQRPAAGRAPTLLDRVDRRQLTIAIVFAIAMVSALAGFIAGRASL
jgi:hypothetical protein